MEITKEMLIAEFARQIDFANFVEINHTAPFRKEFLEYALTLIAELTEENERMRAATAREMQDRLKSLLKTDYINGTREHAISVIDKIAKEMIGEKK